MEAIILAAGVGSRLGRLTADRPKCLLKVAGRSILARQVEALRGVGVDRFVVVTGFRADLVREALDGVATTFVHNPRFQETNVLYSWLLGSTELTDDHFYLHGDTVFERAVLERALQHTGSAIVLTVDRHHCGAEEMKVRVRGARVAEITKNMPYQNAFGEFTGIMLVRASVLPELRQVAKELLAHDDGDRLFAEAALQELIVRRPDSIEWVDVSDLRWREIDFTEDLVAAEVAFRSC